MAEATYIGKVRWLLVYITVQAVFRLCTSHRREAERIVSVSLLNVDINLIKNHADVVFVGVIII